MSQQPVARGERIEALDLLRGFALLGVLLVNNFQFMQPFELAHAPVSLLPDGQSDAWWVWSFIHSLFEFKFVALFSLLFGFGFALQYRRGAAQAGFRGMYVRRLFFLTLFGVLHVLLFYAADILVIYAYCGFVLFLCRNWSASTLIKVGSGLYMLVVLMMQNMGNLSLAIGPLLVVTFIMLLLGRLPLNRFLPIGMVVLVACMVWNHKNTGNAYPKTYETKKALAAELRTLPQGPLPLSSGDLALPLRPQTLWEALTEGSPADGAMLDMASFGGSSFFVAATSRIYRFVRLQKFSVWYFGWRTLALFFLAAGVAKTQPWQSACRPLWCRWAGLGFGLGLPMTVAATFVIAQAYLKPDMPTGVAEAVHELSALLLAGGMAGLFFLWAAKAGTSPLRVVFAAVGRTALSNYLAQSAIMSLLAAGYGLGLYGTLSHPKQIVVVISVYIFLALVSVGWLRVFQMGPLEWVWRCLTYGQRLPLVRR